MDPLPRFARSRMTARMVIRPKWTKREVPACLDCVQHRLWRERQLSAKVSTRAPPKQPLNGNIKMPANHSGGWLFANRGKAASFVYSEQRERSFVYLRSFIQLAMNLRFLVNLTSISAPGTTINSVSPYLSPLLPQSYV